MQLKQVLQHTANRNTFTNELICGLTGTFATIGRSMECKAVVLTGYDNYFSSGSAEGQLRDLFAGRSGSPTRTSAA